MTRTVIILLLGAFFVLLATACAASPNAVADEAPTPTIPAEPTGTPPSEGEPTEIPQAAQPTEAPTEAPPASQPDFLDFLDAITINTPVSGGGTRPILAWDPVDSADRYGVYLYAPNGQLYWSWQGRESSVPVGGRPQLREDALGPSVAEGMTWMVIAYDVDQFPIAVGGLHPIAP
jgi:hypothetical protein